jgi:hypothetical protein
MSMYNKTSIFENIKEDPFLFNKKRKMEYMRKLMLKHRLIDNSVISKNNYKGFPLILLMRNPSSLTHCYKASKDCA